MVCCAGVLLLGPALAQTPEARKAADAAVQGWVKHQFQVDLRTSQEPRATLLQVLRFQQAVPVQQLDASKGRFLQKAEGQESYAYPFQNGQVQGTAVVTVQQQQGRWTAQSVRTALQGTGLPTGLTAPVWRYLFVVLSLVVLLGLLVRSPIQRGFVQAWQVALSRPYRGAFITVQVVLYGAFVLGMTTAYQDPELARELQLYLGSGLTSTGIQAFVNQGVAGLALGITTWNFVSGAFLTTFLPGLLLGVPAVLFNLLRFGVLGVGLSPALIPPEQFVPHIPVMVLELQAYIFVAAFAVVTTLRMFREGFGVAVRAYPLALLVALVFLLLGNWYEAFELLYLVPRGGA